MLEPCIFCGFTAKRNRTKEHIVPEWLEKFLNIENEVIQPTHFTSNGDIRSVRQHPVDQFLCGGVCNHCNEGWMSSLETENMGLLKQLIEAGLGVDVIRGTKEAQHLARWACKTAYALHAASNYRRIIPTEHYRILCGNKGMIPSRVFVLGMTRPATQKFSWHQSTSWKIMSHVPFEKADKQRLYESGYKIVLQFGSLLLLVAYNPFKNDRNRIVQFMPNRYTHTNLFPRRGPCSWSINHIDLPKNSISAGFHLSAELGLAFLDPKTRKREFIQQNGPWEIYHSDDPTVVAGNPVPSSL